jgi:hypothetical protein
MLPENEKQRSGVTGKEKSKAAQIGPVSVSLLIHLAFMMVIGGVVIIEQVIPKTSFKAAVLGESFDQQTTEETVPDETLPDPGAAANPELPMDSMEPQAAPAQDTMDVMAVNSPVASSSWMVASAPAVGAVGKAGTSGGGGTASSGTGKGPRMKNPFGDLTRTAGSLQGSFYDLKQTPDRKPSGMDPKKYFDVVREFEKKGWNPNVLKDFYKASQPVYATQLFIPLQGAGGAPKAFNVEKEVLPAQWLILYEGTFRVPATDKYRFVGYADDVLMVRVNGQTVLDGSRGGMTGEVVEKDALAKVKQTVDKQHKAGNGWLAYGEWVDLDQSTPQRIEVLLGERPGGQFCAFLMVEAKAATYKKEASGRPILPLFQLAETDLAFDAEISKGLAPAYAKEPLLMVGEK